MNPRQQALMNRIQTFAFDEPGTRLRFAARLARENGWSVAHAERVLEEYRRFCFLAMEAGHPATPSEDVDQAWHLHLVYTRSYWEEFCPKVLGAPLHHGPTKGGAQESAKHDDWYRRTLESYERLFGEKPPADIWPASENRFDHDLAWKRVNWRDHWIISKRKVHRAAALLAACVVVVLLVGCDQNDRGNPLNWKGPAFLGLYFGLFVSIIIVNLFVRLLLTRGSGDSMPNLSAYELAYMQGGKYRLFLTATTDLTRRGHLKAVTAKDCFVKAAPLPADASGIDREVVSIHDSSTSLLRSARNPTIDVEPLRQRLIEEGLVLSPGRSNAIRWLNALPLFALLAFGAQKIRIGIDIGAPVEILIFGCVVTFFVALAFLVRPIVTGRGKRLLRNLRAEHKDWKNGSSNFTGDNDRVARAVALFGVSALAVGAYAHLHDMMRPLPGSSDASGSGGGCSSSTSSGGCGSDGGGGGGGCGGCGGGGGD